MRSRLDSDALGRAGKLASRPAAVASLGLRAAFVRGPEGLRFRWRAAEALASDDAIVVRHSLAAAAEQLAAPRRRRLHLLQRRLVFALVCRAGRAAGGAATRARVPAALLGQRQRAPGTMAPAVRATRGLRLAWNNLLPNTAAGIKVSFMIKYKQI